MTRRWLWALLGIAGLAHIALLAPLPILAQSIAALVLAGLVPGLLLVEAVIGRAGDAAPGPWERAVYSIAAGIGVMVLAMLLVSYLPGPVARWQTIAAFDVVLLALWGIAFARAAQPPAPVIPEWREQGVQTRWLLAGALVLLVLGGVLRFANLGYPDYQGDEARAALRAAAVIQGYDDVLMLHKKGPTEILLPTVLYSMTGHLTEQTARLPFALAGFTALFAVWILGWRLWNPLAGWLAALFVALDGYFIGFSRIVQYQSVVLLMSVLAVLVLVRLLRQTRAIAPYLSVAALFLATGIHSHYEGVLAALPVAVLLVTLWWRERAQRRAIVVAALIAAGVGALLLALFYVPYILNPRFAATYTYLTDRRIGSAFPYNNLSDVFLRTTLYSTTYAVLLLIGLAVAGMIRVFAQGLRRPLAIFLSVAAVALVAVTFWNPQWALVGDATTGKDWIIVPVALLLAAVILTPGQRAEDRVIWLWFGAVLVLALFLTEKPRTHVYTFFIPWMLLAGSVAAAGWAGLRGRIGPRPAMLAGAGAAAALILLFGAYAYAFFASRGEVMFNYNTLRPSGYWTAYTEPDDKARFGFPLNNGWKVVGELYGDGTLQGPFETSEKEAWVPAWYGRGVERCRREAEWFFEIRNLEPFSHQDFLAMEHFLRQGFEKWARVQVAGTDKMIVYKRTGNQVEFPTQAPVDGLPVYAFENFAAAFDAHALADLPLTYPSIDPAIANPLDVNFGDTIRLEGYAIDYPKPLRPGDTIRLTLYWRGQKPIDKSYKVFNQVIFGDGPMIAQRDGYPVCDGRETWRWDPGELITDVYNIPVNADAPDGLYPLNTGLYLEETGERLPVLDANGVEIASQAHITDIRVGEE